MLPGVRIMKTRKTDIASKLRHELSSDVASHRVTLQILYSNEYMICLVRLPALFDA